jgi:hypothetical protein
MTPPGGAVYKKVEVSLGPDGFCVGPIYPGETAGLGHFTTGYSPKIVNCSP